MSYRKLLITTVILIMGIFVSIAGSGKDDSRVDDKSITYRVPAKDDIRLQIQNGHSNGIWVIKSSPDGRFIATLGPDQKVCIWNKNLVLIKEIFMTRYLTCLEFSSDSKKIIFNGDRTAYQSDDFFIYDIYNETMISFASGMTMDNFLTVNYNDTIATVTGNGITIFNLKGERIRSFSVHKSRIVSLQFAVLTDILVSIDQDNRLIVWDATTGNILDDIIIQKDMVFHDVSPDGKLLAFSAESNDVIFYDVQKKVFVRPVAKHPAKINLVRIIDKNYFITYCKGYGLNLWDYSGNYKRQYVVESNRFSICPDRNTILLIAGESLLFRFTLFGNSADKFRTSSRLVTAVDYSEKNNTIINGVLNINAGTGSVQLWENGAFKLEKLAGRGYINRIETSPGLEQILLSFGTWSMFSNSKTDLEEYKAYGMKVTILDSRFSHVKDLSDYHSTITSLQYCNEDKFMTSSKDGVIKISDLNGNDITKITDDSIDENTIATNCFSAVSNDDKFVATIRYKEKKTEIKNQSTSSVSICIFDFNGNKISEFNTNELGFIRFTADNNLMVYRMWGGFSWFVKIYDFSGKVVMNMNNGSDNFYYRCGDILENKKIIAAGTNEGIVQIWGYDNRVIKAHNFHRGTITSVRFIGNDRVLLTTVDGSMIIWDTSSDNCVYFNGSDNGSGIAYTDDGYYRLSGDYYDFIHYVKKIRSYGFDQFDLRHNRPDIVLERLYPDVKSRPKNIQEQITRYKKYWEFRVARNGFTPEQVSGETKIHSPQVYDIKLNGIPIDKADTNVKQQEVTLSFKIKDEDGSDFKVIGYKIFVNGVPVHGQYIKRFGKPGRVQDVTEKITLSSVPDVGTGAGDNKIEISGFTEDGVESGRETVYLKYECKETKGDLYIVCLGVNDYSRSTGFQSLEYAVGDVSDIVSTFTAAGKGRYNKIIPVVYTENQVTRDVVKTIKEKLAKSSVNDTVVFFISGHGMRADTDVSTAADVAKYFGIGYGIGDITDNKNRVNIYYYMTGESSSKEPWVKGIPMDAIRYCLDAIPARQKLLLIDTCQSGENNVLSGYTPSEERLEEVRKKRSALAGGKNDRGVKLVRGTGYSEKGVIIEAAYNLDLKEMSEMFPELRRGTGTIEISASTGNQSALESEEWRNGAFTFVIKEAILRGGAKDSSGKITAKTLRGYVLDRVEQLTGGDQTPMVCRDIAGRDFVIGE